MRSCASNGGVAENGSLGAGVDSVEGSKGLGDEASVIKCLAIAVADDLIFDEKNLIEHAPC